MRSMSQIRDEVLAANAAYAASFGERAGLAVPPARRFAILTCMDARLDPARFAGLAEGDAHVVRNAGGRASDDAIRSLVISCKLLGTREWFVVHHTECGMETFTDEVVRQLEGESEGDFVDWLPIRDREETLVADVRRLRDHPLVPPTVQIYGFVYDVKTGKLEELPEATAAGRAELA